VQTGLGSIISADVLTSTPWRDAKWLMFGVSGGSKPLSWSSTEPLLVQYRASTLIDVPGCSAAASTAISVA
jgi:hypothetical protein